MKHKVKQYILRAAPLILVCCMFVFVLSPSASADGIDYNDLNPTIEVDGENDIVTFSFAPDQFWSYLFGDSYSGTAFNGSFTFEGKAGVAYDIYTNLTPSYLETKNIPDDTLLSFSFRIVADSPAYSTPDVLLTYRYWRDGEVYDSVQNTLDRSALNFGYSGDVTLSSSFDGISFESGIWHLIPYYDGNISIIFDEMVFTMSINSAYRAALLSQKNSQIIKEIEKQLAEQGKTMDQFLEQQEQTNEKLDDAIYGDHGFDSSDSDFSGMAGDLSNSAGQANDAMSAGMDSLGSMMDSDAFNGTLNVLAAGLDAVFTGHEVTICGVTGNPFTLLVGVAAIAIILMLAMKFIFRKWGSGGSDSSGGGSSDA